MIIDRVAFVLYLVVLVLSPLLFGAVHTYAYTLVTLLVLSASLLLIFQNVTKDQHANARFFRWPATSLNPLFFLVLFYLFFQVALLPGFLVNILSPGVGVIAEKSQPASQVFTLQHRAPALLSLIPYRYPVWMSVFRWITYGLFFFGFIQTLKSRKRIEIVIGCILATACFSSLYGIFQTYSEANHIWWFTKTAYLKDVTGTYINRNHFACFMGIALILAAAYSCSLLSNKQSKKRNFRNKFRNFLAHEQTVGKTILVVASGVVIGVGLILSASRGGILSTTAGLFCVGFLFLCKRSQRRNGFIVLIIFCLIAFFNFYIGAEYSWKRFLDINTSYEIRSRYVETTMSLFNDFNLLGVGIGNFRYAYPKYQQAQDSHVFIEYAHNDWVQFLAEAGIVGFCFFLFGIVFYLFQTFRIWKIQEDPFPLALSSASLATLFMIGIHSYSDFNLHILANFLTMTAIIAIGYAACRLESGTEEIEISRPQFHFFPMKISGGFFLALTFLLVFFTGWWSIRHFIAETYCNTVRNSTFNRNPFPSEDEVKKAIFWQQGNATYSYKLAQALMKKRKDDIAQKTYVEDSGIIQALENAVRLNPLEAAYHIKLGWKYLDQLKSSDKKEKWQTAADLSMQRAAFFLGERNPWHHKELGDYWIIRSKEFPPNSLQNETALATAQAHYKKAFYIQGDYGRLKLKKEIEKTIKRNYPLSEGLSLLNLAF